MYWIAHNTTHGAGTPLRVPTHGAWEPEKFEDCSKTSASLHLCGKKFDGLMTVSNFRQDKTFQVLKTWTVYGIELSRIKLVA
ncbi:hypothetical protein [Candidatus Venteria ishoeyi]|uniref:Uncharacterized protein n=1 Tax=Candidatus Venteria ishoeyi TaxID=1899563 RepID=A0A1H6F5C3_9GAMM|nr:hypothetical protein [Candidatus Venteria ishoeyi]SEH04276.1 Uncharacterised protein [Candidatus Venteria ishoeyi]